MKKNLKFWNVFLGMLALVCVCTACSDDDDEVVNKPGQEQGQVDKNVPQAVATAFDKKFPNATNVTWKERQGYYVASFDLKTKGRALDTQLNQAWFLKDGTMSLSEVDVPKNVFESDAFYAKVLAAWKASAYLKDGFQIDEVELLTRNGSAAQVVKVEIEKGKEEFDLYFTLDGLLVKAVPDTDSNDDADENLPCPVELEKIVAQLCPGAVLIDFEPEDEGFEVSVLTKMGQLTVEKDLVFDKTYKFLYAEIDFDDKVLAGLIQKYLTKEEIAKIAEITGNNNPEEWDIEIVQFAEGNIKVSVEAKDGKDVTVLELDKDFKPVQRVPAAVASAFQKGFPEATNVTWNERKGFWVASFDLAKGRAAAVAPKNLAWYQQDGTFNMSQLEVPVNVLEGAAEYAKIWAAWQASSYFADGFQIDDIDLMKRAGSSDAVVKIEIEKGKEEFDLYFTLDGLLVKAVADTDTPDTENDDVEDNLPCPAELIQYLEAKYPKAVVVDFEQDNDDKGVQYEVTVLTYLGALKVEKELVFDKDFHFLYAEVEFDNKVLATLIQKFLTPEQIAKLVELTGEKNPEEWDIEIIENEKGLYTISIEDKNDKMVEVMKDLNLNDFMK